MKQLAVVLAWLAALAPDAPAPLRVAARVATPAPHYVGQGVEIRVEVDEAAEVVPPRTPGTDAEVRPAGKDRPASRFVVIPRRPGPLVIPPFRARAGGREGSSRPTRLAAEAPPTPGRSAAFLGGIGPFEVSAEASPASIRLGGTLEYRLRLNGPAAWGSDRAPDLAAWAALGLRVEPPPAGAVEGEPPGRTFRYRVRPGRAGRAVLPPVAVAAFDPTARRYVTRVSRGVAIEVAEPPRFDPGRLDYGPAGGARPGRVGTMAGVAVAALALVGVAARIRRRRRQGRTAADPRRVAAGLAEGLGTPGGDGPEAARRAVDALARFLQVVEGRPPGALTPPEAREAVARLGGDKDLAGRAARLVESCDRARFGGGVVEPARLSAEARAVLGSMGEAAGGRGPREAAETA